MKAAELFVRCLENEKVQYIFGLPGEENMDLLDALIDSPIEFISTRHEQVAAFMADVYGRLTGKSGVRLANLGPGATNRSPGVADGYIAAIDLAEKGLTKALDFVDQTANKALAFIGEKLDAAVAKATAWVKAAWEATKKWVAETWTNAGKAIREGIVKFWIRRGLL